MYPINLSSSSFFQFQVIIVIVTTSFIILISGDDVTPSSSSTFSNCNNTFSCGSVTNLTYPFTGGDRPDYCGHPEFRLTCRNEFAELTIHPLTYRVAQVNQNQKTLTLARLDLWNNTCPEKFINSTLDLPIFDYSGDNQALTLFYACSPLAFKSYNQFSCNVTGRDDNLTDAYYLVGSVPTDPNLSVNTTCNLNVLVPMLKSAADRLTSNQTDIGEALTEGFGVDYSVPNESECLTCMESGGLCGYDSDSHRFACYCGNQICKRSEGSGLGVGLSLAIGIPTSVAGIMVVLGLICCYRRKHILNKPMIFIRRKKTKNDLDVDAFIKDNGSLLALKQYNYSEVKKMTKSFTDKLGQGGYGSVYKGKLLDGHLVAVKLLSESKGNGEEFLNEVASISRTAHVNVVTLLGFCYERTKRALIYEFMPNGSLDQFIYLEKSSNTNSQLEWKTLFRIAVGIARGLEYLHNGCNTRILHFDIKPHNILLDEEFCPKISDFGLAKLCQRKESIISMLGARGTAGYIAPEVFSRHFGGVSYKSDVYSYGMMILEIVGGRRNIEAGVSQTSEIYFPHWIFKYLEPASTELRLNRVITEDVEEELARKMILVGLWCIQTKPSDRPSMTRVVEMLEGNIQSLQIPPKPFLSSPPRSPPHHSSTISVSESSSNIG